MKVALYTRVSTEEQAQRQSIETQLERLRDYCRLKEYAVVKEYKDNGVSGAVPLEKRPAGGELLREAAGGSFDAVVVYKLDRVGRTLINVVDAHDRLSQVGVALESATEPMDTTNPAGKFVFHMFASFAQLERENIRERTQHGIQRAYRSGVQVGRIPYGYDITEDGRWVVVEEEAAVMRRVYTQVAEGTPVDRIVRMLNEEGVPAPGVRYKGQQRRPGKVWYQGTLATMLKKSTYRGVHVVRVSGGKSIRREVPAIVDDILWETAQRAMKESRHQPRGGKNRVYLLTGLMTCRVCGRNYVGTSSRVRGKLAAYYRCRGSVEPDYLRRYPSRHAPLLPADEVESLVWSRVKELLQSPPQDIIRRFTKENDALKQTGEELRARIVRLEGHLKKLEAGRERLVRAYTRGMVDDEGFDAEAASLKAEAENTRSLIDSLRARLRESALQRSELDQVSAFLTSVRDRLQSIADDPASKRRIISLLVDTINVGYTIDGEVSVELTYRVGSSGEVLDKNGNLQRFPFTYKPLWCTFTEECVLVG